MKVSWQGVTSCQCLPTGSPGWIIEWGCSRGLGDSSVTLTKDWNSIKGGKWSSVPPLPTHRPADLLASYASHKSRWWWPGWWSQPEPRGGAIRGPGGCGPSAPTSPHGCRTRWWRCTGTRPDPSRCPGWRCGARCSCPCCWRRNVRLSCQFPTEGKGNHTSKLRPFRLWAPFPIPRR